MIPAPLLEAIVQNAVSQAFEQFFGAINGGQTASQLHDIILDLNEINASAADAAVGISEAGATIEAMLNQIQATLASMQDVQNQLGNAVNPTGSATPPPPPPAPPSSGDNADAVWGYPLANQPGYTTGEAVQFLNSLLYTWAYADANLRSSVYGGYRVGTGANLGAVDVRGPTVSPLDFSTILPSDASILAWATRVYPSVTWHSAGPWTVWEWDAGASRPPWVIDLNEAEFKALQATPSGSNVVVPPVWPGLANVTLGTSQALADGLVIVGPLSGVILSITGVPPATPFYAFGTRLSYKWLGAVTFVDDNNQAEEAQPLGFDHLIITPRKMAQAASAVLRLKSGTTGTVQPFLNH
jgi:hypothetical protein